VRAHGSAESALQVETDAPKPSLSKGQILIQNKFSGLNFIDTYFRTGLYKQDLPFVSGGEGGGYVSEIHPETETDLIVGDQVVYMSFGSLAEFTAVPHHKAVKVPEGIPLETAVACMVQGLTAHYLVTDATAGLIHKDEWCLIYSVGSGTCQWAAQMAKLRGFRVIGTTSQSKADASKGLCDELIVLGSVAGKTYSDYSSVDVVSRVMEITNGEGVKLILDGVGKSTVDISISCLARRGIFVSFGNASGAVPPISLLRLAPTSGFCTRPKLFDYVATREELEVRCRDVFEWVKAGDIKVTIDKIFPLAQASDGHTYLESGLSRGKILYRI
jgi:NADPH2:quinone reductase